MNRETFTRLVRKELSGLRRFLMAACSGNGDEADDIAPLLETHHPHQGPQGRTHSR